MAANQNNIKIINSLNARVKPRMELTIVDGLVEICEEAMNSIIGGHDRKHHFHLDTEGSFGWIVTKDGQVLRQWLNDTGDKFHMDGLVENARSMSPDSGYACVVIAGMTHWQLTFSVPFERNLFLQAYQDTRNGGVKYFKKM